MRRAAWFYEDIRYSYASDLKSFGGQPHDIWRDFPLIQCAARRLGRVVIDCRDFQDVIRQYDSPTSFFYCDPPYYMTESYYKNVGEKGFTVQDHVRLRDTLLDIDGKFLLSYNDDPYIRSLYDWPGITIETVSRLNNIRQRYEAGCRFKELLIANYDTAPAQMSLFIPDDTDAQNKGEIV